MVWRVAASNGKHVCIPWYGSSLFARFWWWSSLVVVVDEIGVVFAARRRFECQTIRVVVRVLVESVFGVVLGVGVSVWLSGS